jgi:hypothetical protein
MATTVSVSPSDLPDINATKHDDGSYELEITGLTGLLSIPRAIDLDEKALGIISANPPRIRSSDVAMLDLLMLRAIEKALPDGLLDNVEGVEGALDKEQLLCAQIVRTVRRALIALEPPE